MTTEEQKAVDEKCDEFCEYRRTHSNGYPPREWFMAGVKALDDLRNLSEPKTKVGEPSEELVEKITNILKSNERLENVWLAPKWATVSIIDHSQFEKVATEIAKLLQPDVNAELLSALKKLCDVARNYIVFPDDGLDNSICDAMLTVYDYEQKQQ